MARLRFASLVAAACIACFASVAYAGSTCEQPSSGAQIVPTGEFSITPQGNGGSLENPLRPGITDTLLMLTFGDSAMWGNGLNKNNKYANMVAQHVANGTGRAVSLVTYSHSSATISKTSGEKYVPLEDTDNGIPRGDLNAGLPTMFQQEGCAAARPEYRGAEIILLNGCINDVSAEGIALPFPLGGLGVDEIERRTHQWCSDTMLELLRNTKQDFPQATVIVANYWLIISDKSSPVGKAIRNGANKDATAQDKAIYREMQILIEQQRKAEALSGKLRTDSMDDVKTTIRKWSDGSRAFLDSSTQCFNWAIATANGATTTPNGSDACADAAYAAPRRSTGGERVFLATVSDDPNYSYGAPQKRIWSVPISPNPHDQTYKPRQKLCTSHYEATDLLERFICRVNPTAHPNFDGAQAYRDSISHIMNVAWAVDRRLPSAKR